MAKGNLFSKIKTAQSKVAKRKALSKEEKNSCISDMQKYLDGSDEKKQLFINVVKNHVDADTGMKIIDKGIVVYARLLDTVKLLEEVIGSEGIEFKTITGKVSAKKRGQVEDWFDSSPKNKIVFISDAGSASLNLNATNEIILYNIPDGYRKFKQTIGRVARIGKWDKYNIHSIIVEDSRDEWMQTLISSRKQLENELLSCDSIPLKGVSSFNAEVLKKERKRLLWRNAKTKKKK